MRPINLFLKSLILTALLLSTQSFGQEARSLTLDQSIQIGLKNSNQIHASLMKVKKAEAQASEVGASRFFSLNAGATYTRLSKVPPFAISTPFGNFEISPSIYDNYNLKLSLQQPIFTGFKLSSSYDAAKLNASAVNQDYTKDEQDLLLQIKNAYWSLFKATQIKKVLDDDIQTVKAHLEDVRNFYKQGLATQNDVLKVQVQLSQVQLQQIDAMNGVKLAMLNLNNVIGLPLSTEIKLADSVSVNDVNSSAGMSLDVLVEKALKNRPELKAMKFRVNASDKGITAAKGDWYPQVFVAGEYDYSKPNQRLLPTQNKFYGTWNVSVGLSYKLWNWGATIDKTEQAEADFEQAKDGYKLLKDAVTLDVNQNYFNLVKAREKVAVAEQTVKQAEENYRVTDEKFKQGLTLNSELLDAEVALTQARTNYIQSLVDYELSMAKLDRATGIK